MLFTNLWENIPLEQKKLFEAEAIQKNYKRGDLIYSQGDNPQGLYFISSGLVGLKIISADTGKEHLLRFFRKGQFFGHRSLFSNEGYHGSSYALESTSIYFLSKQTVTNAIEKQPKLLEDIVQVLSKELRRCETQHVMVVEMQILPRVAQSIVYLKELDPNHKWTRQEIADFCGSTVSTVIKAMAELEKMGLILQEGRMIQILNRDNLIKLGE